MTTSSNLDIEHLVSNPSSPEVPVNEAFDLIDSCVADQVTIDFASDADLTLSTTGSAPQQWQYLSLKLTDTGVLLTTGRNVIVPDNNKMYLVFNSTAQTLTVKTSAGTGATVAASANRLVYCDGTNIVEPGVTGTGDVVGPASAVDRAIMVADGVTGKAVIGTLVYIDASGNVGIGTASPARLLHISSGTVATAVRFESSRTDGGGSYIDLKDGNTTADFKVGIGCDADGAIIRAGGSPRVSVLSDGKTGIGTTTPTEKLDIDSNAMRLRTAKTPASASAAGNPGTIAWDSDYIYVCVATNTWKRASLATW